jgi:hypothetical protein
MRRFSCRSMNWLSCAVFSALAVAGEGLHLVPGFGHYHELPSGELLGIGVRTIEQARSAESSPLRFRLPHPVGAPIVDAGLCPICVGLAQVQQKASSVELAWASSVAQRTVVAATGAESSGVLGLRSARAPPAV